MNPTYNPIYSNSIEISLQAQTEILNNIEKIEVKSIKKLKQFIEDNKTILNSQVKVGLNILNQGLEKRISEIKKKTSGIFAFFIYLIFWRSTKNNLLNEAAILSDYQKYFNQFSRELKYTQPKQTIPSIPQEDSITSSIIAPPFDLQKNDLLQPLVEDPSIPSNVPLPPAPPFISPLINKGTSTSKSIEKTFIGEPDEPTIVLNTAHLKKLTQSELDKEIIEIEEFVKKMKNSLLPIEKTLKEVEQHRTELKDINKALKLIQTELLSNYEKLQALIEGENEKSDFTLLQYQIEPKRKQIMPFYSDQMFQQITDLLIKNGGKALEKKFSRTLEITIIKTTISDLEAQKNVKTKEINHINTLIKNLESSSNNNILFPDYDSLLNIKNSKLSKWERALNYRKKQTSNQSKTNISNKPLKTGINIKIDLNHQLMKDPNIQHQIPEITFLASFIENHDALLQTKIDSNYHKKIGV